MQQDVFGLDIAVDDAVAVGVVEGAGDFAGGADGGVQGELLFATQPIAERLPPRRTA